MVGKYVRYLLGFRVSNRILRTAAWAPMKKSGRV
jgi:hypothetical protein